MAISTSERRVYAILFPTLDGLQQRFLGPLDEVSTQLEQLAMDFQNVAGEIGTERWEVSLESPPSLEDLGAFTVFVDLLENRLETLQESTQGLRDLIPMLGELWDEGRVRFD